MARPSRSRAQLTGGRQATAAQLSGARALSFESATRMPSSGCFYRRPGLTEKQQSRPVHSQATYRLYRAARAITQLGMLAMAGAALAPLLIPLLFTGLPVHPWFALGMNGITRLSYVTLCAYVFTGLLRGRWEAQRELS